MRETTSEQIPQFVQRRMYGRQLEKKDEAGERSIPLCVDFVPLYRVANEKELDLFEWSNEKRPAKKTNTLPLIPQRIFKMFHCSSVWSFLFANYIHFSGFLAARFPVCNDNQSFHT